MTFSHHDKRKFNTAPQNGGVDSTPKRAAPELPIDAHRESILEAVKNNPSAIIVGETGSGKTTKTPVFLLEAFPGKRIAVTSPRVLPARSVSKYVAEQRGGSVGGEIGLMTRETKNVSQETRATFMTDGILLSMLRNDPMLRDLDVVMVDEAHERTINIDLALGLLKQAQHLRKEAGGPELKIVVTSATIEEQKFADYFEEAPVAKVPGRMYPVEVSYHEPNDNDTIAQAARVVDTILSSGNDGDILIFMPGEDEIKKTITEIEKTVDYNGVEVFPLYGSMNPQEQDKIFNRNDKRKIIVSTNIAETSVTIDGVKHVIDAGDHKQINYNPETGINTLELTKASQANMNQRMGRAGRTAPGKCYRLISKEEFEEREAFQKPELLRSDLDEVILRMKDMGIQDVEGFDFIDKPSRISIHSALESLQQLGALDEKGDITAVGKEMARLALRPDLSRMLIEAKHLGALPEMIDLCSMMSASRQVFIKPKNRDDPLDYDRLTRQNTLKVAGSDPLTLLNVWNKWVESGYEKDFALDHLLNMKSLREIGQTRLQLLKALAVDGGGSYEQYSAPDKFKIAKCLLSGIPDALFYSNDFGRNYIPLSIDQHLRGTRVFPGSSVFKNGSQLMLAMNITKSEKKDEYGIIQSTLYARNCHNITLDELRAILPDGSIVEKPVGNVYWSYSLNSYAQRQEVYIHGTLVTTTETKAEAPEILQEDRSTNSWGSSYFRTRVERPFEASAYTVSELFPDLSEQNFDVRKKVQSYFRRAPEDIRQAMKRRLFPIDNSVYYREVIDLLKLKTKEDFIAHKDVFEIKLHEYITQDEIAKIDAEFPENIVANGKDFKVDYDDSVSGNKKISIQIEDIEDVAHLQGITLPSFGGASVIFSLKKSQVIARASRFDTGFYMRSYAGSSQDQEMKFTSLEELVRYYEQEKKAKEKRERRKDRKATEGGLIGGEEGQSYFSEMEKEVPSVIAQNDQMIKTNEQKEKVAPISLEIADMRGLLSYLRGVTQEKNVRELKDKEKVLDRIKEISGKLSQSAKELEESGGSVLNQGTVAELLQSLRALAKRIGMSPAKAEQLPYIYKHNKNALMASLARNEVTLDEELDKKIATKSADRSFESDVIFTEDEADEIIIDLV